MFQDKIFQIKEINGEQITSAQLFEYFKVYSSVFRLDKIPCGTTLLRATEQANNLAAKVAAKEYYIRKMSNEIKSNILPRSRESFERIHENIKNKAFKHFCNSKRTVREDLNENCLDELNKEIDIEYKSSLNRDLSTKTIFNHPTPTCLLIFMLLNYSIGSILRIFWLGWFSFIFSIGFYVSFILLISWGYMIYYNQHTEYLPYIDLAASYLWTEVSYK
jgi:hypothetical protein